jgi:prepilin-type N-terminal cleavage/methylation domain-containing protein
MNSQFKIKLLQNLAKNKTNKGFTLIELLVVVIIIGVLAAIALPNLLGQVAKGRQAEAKNNLGAINRGQQAYRSEKGVFVPLTNTQLGVKITGQYYSYTDGLAATGNSTYGSYIATAAAGFVNDIKNYASAVNQDTSGNFAAVICESTGTAAAAGTVTPSVGNNTAATLNCGAFNTVN